MGLQLQLPWQSLGGQKTAHSWSGSLGKDGLFKIRITQDTYYNIAVYTMCVCVYFTLCAHSVHSLQRTLYTVYRIQQ